jgi:hypothetical protein
MWEQKKLLAASPAADPLCKAKTWEKEAADYLE